MHYLNLKNVDLGSGKRPIVPDGVYVAKYQITVPKTLEAMA
ncbi:MAG: type IV toxin-antitoxin system AbiEi family antitoxin domain-containing protein [Wenzhouxiangella sp.]|nr:type IV toxin-antitoxin system AbiEi family antitoxin domain-containing protein [Wenzhouxiangella sp.]